MIILEKKLHLSFKNETLIKNQIKNQIKKSVDILIHHKNSINQNFLF